MATVNFKMESTCAGKEHAKINLTPGPTVDVTKEGIKEKVAAISEMTTALKTEWLLAFHAEANNLSIGELGAQLESIPGVDMTI